jgi:hypothetical protein
MSAIWCTSRHGWYTERTHRATAERILRAKVYAGMDPLTGREIRFRKTCKTERAAQIELGKLLAMAQAGRQPDSDVIVAQLLSQYVLTAGWHVSTRVSNLGYIRRTNAPGRSTVMLPQIGGRQGELASLGC